MSPILDFLSAKRYIRDMNLWERLSALALWPVTRVPWGMDRGVNGAEYARYRRDFQRGVIAFFAALIAVDEQRRRQGAPAR